MRRMLSGIVMLLMAIAVGGCATLFAGGSETVRIESEPAGATVTTQNGLTLGTTPLLASLKPRDYVLQFAKPGFGAATHALSKKVDGIAFLNLLCVLCWGVDFATGAVWGLEEEFVKVTLAPQSAEAEQKIGALACANYSALDQTAAQGRIDFAALLKGRQLLAEVTGVSDEECRSSGPMFP